MKYPIKSKEGCPILTVDNAAIPLYGIKDLFSSNSPDNQIELCQKLGISFLTDSIAVSFKESGKAYGLPNEDRNVTKETETEHAFNLVFQTKINKSNFPLKLTFNLNECTNQPFVNFLGEIRFYNSIYVEVVVPLTGRGTAALEGKVDDVHAGLCTSSKSASFQERVAILSCILACFEMSRDNIEIFRAHLLKTCRMYHGTEDILSYTIDKAFSLTDISYFEYMKSTYVEKELPLMLNHFIEFGEPHPIYFYELTSHLSAEEIDNELKYIHSTSKGPDHQQISSKVREIINKFILSDDIYLIKPYPGNSILTTENTNMTIYDIATEFNSNCLERSLEVLKKLGIIVNDDVISVTFVEIGKKYSSNNEKIVVDQNISEEKFQLNLRRKSSNSNPILKLQMFLDIEPIDNVNFFGKIEIRNSFFKRIIIPLIGRGTVALEGTLNNKEMGFCTGSNCASFLQRVAIMYCSLVLLDVDLSDLNLFEMNIRSINNQYHGRHKLVDYIFKVAKSEETASYFEYMTKTNMNYSTMPIVLKTILTYNRLPSKYYEDVISKFSEEELIKEEERFDKSYSYSLISRTIRQTRQFLQNMNIF